MRRSLIAVTLLLAVLVGCRPGSEPSNQPAPVQPAAAAEDLASARKGFVTRLRVRGPARSGIRTTGPPAGVKEVAYTSGDLKFEGVALDGRWRWQEAARGGLPARRVGVRGG